GDAVMALFPEKADDAVEAAVFSQHAIAQYNDEHKKKGFEPIIVGTGIHCGNLILGTIGTESRMDTTVISDAVNTAARMEGLTVIYGGNIIVTGSLVEQLQDKSAFHYRYLDTVKVKGKDQSTVIYEILDGLDNAAIDAKLSSLIFYKEAIAHYKQAELSTALDGFRKVLDINPADIASQLYVERCEHYLKVGIPDKWDGSQQMTTKKG
ncbi:MAG: adenylate/guanylate cyclase domain-containing protein, partial [Bacteroidota bacterium]